MKNKMLTLFLVLLISALILPAACSNTITSTSTAAPATTAAPAQTTTAAPKTTADAANSKTTTAAPASTTTSAQVFTLKFSTFGQTTEFPTIISYYFLDYIEKNSNGRIKVERYPGGLLGTSAEQFNLLKSGSADFANFGPFYQPQALPMHAYPQAILGGSEAVLAFYEKLNFTIPETSAILEKERTDNNIKLLQFFPVGETILLAKKDFTSLADLKSMKIGAVAAAHMAVWQTLGYNAVQVMVPDMYEALSRGQVDAVMMAFSAVMGNSWYEVTKCCLGTDEFSASSNIAINLNTWNKLPADLQQVLIDGAKAMKEYAVKLDAEQSAKDWQTLKDKGLTTGKLPAADIDSLYKASLAKWETDAMANLSSPVVASKWVFSEAKVSTTIDMFSCTGADVN